MESMYACQQEWLLRWRLPRPASVRNVLRYSDTREANPSSPPVKNTMLIKPAEESARADARWLRQRAAASESRLVGEMLAVTASCTWGLALRAFSNMPAARVAMPDEYSSRSACDFEAPVDGPRRAFERAKTPAPPPADRRWRLRTQPGTPKTPEAARRPPRPPRHRRLWDGTSTVPVRARCPMPLRSNPCTDSLLPAVRR